MDNASPIAELPPATTESDGDASAGLSAPTDGFVRRHIGPDDVEVQEMLAVLGLDSLEALVEQTVPASIRLKKPLKLPTGQGEHAVLESLRQLAGKNKIFRSYLGMGYSDTITPAVIQRNILENPGWYTQYTPYQAEIAQGRLEALLNFQTMVADLTALPLANASLLDEATAAAEAMHMCRAIAGEDNGKNAFFVAADCHPQTIAVVQTRAKSIGVECVVAGPADLEKSVVTPFFGVLLQYPTTDGRIVDYTSVIERVHAAGGLVAVAADLLALTLIKPPGEFGADIAVGSTQRFGVPMGFGGPHAAYISTKTEFARKLPGRLVGVSRDARGKSAFRLTIQTREQHIKREKATSNICTAQVLLAVMAGMYAVYHGPHGLRKIAQRVFDLTSLLADTLRKMDLAVADGPFFDTIDVQVDSADAIIEKAEAAQINLRRLNDRRIGVSLDETTTVADVQKLVKLFDEHAYPPSESPAAPPRGNFSGGGGEIPTPFARTSKFLEHPVFNRYHSETEMLRYIKRLESRDLSLAQSMIPLGSCTMKLNATTEMLPVTWPHFARLHPFAPPAQTRGYQKLFADLEKWLAVITGFAAVSLQPNAGSQGEYAGLLTIRAYHQSRGDTARNLCLIPVSAHGTNPSSAVAAGFEVVPVACDANGNVDAKDLAVKAAEHADKLAALMITYPSTHGVFEEGVKHLCKIVHDHGGLVYMDGANMNAQVGLCRPGDIGADVCHLNLHKTFCIPHGGGGPGMGPIAVNKKLAPFLPTHPLITPDSAGAQAIGPVSAAPYGSPAILCIPYAYIAMMGGEGLTRATEVAILNANYMAAKLAPHYPVLFKGSQGRVAHEFVIDCRAFESSAGVKVEDIAKRLMDYGYHAPTMSWPVPGTLMIEPTESESKAELDRFCDAMISIREEIRAVESGAADRTDNPLKNAPHPAEAVIADNWPHKYTREQAAYPARHLREYKFWPAVARIDNPFGDRNLVCTCPPVDSYGT
jgi:glycine dehydrogenase